MTTSSRILVIDDEDLFREDIADLLRRHGHECETAGNGQEGLAALGRYDPEIVLCDLVMPDCDGLTILDKILEVSPGTSVIMITAFGGLETAVDAFRRGAIDYITKPLLIEDVLQKIRRIIDQKHLSREITFLRREVSVAAGEMPLVGPSEPMQAVRKLVEDVVSTRSTVMLTGESGTGKEVVARSIWAMSGSPQSPFVAINCAGISPHLLESELFGHVKGAFTDAISHKEGFFELAGDGIVFLDEIAEIPLELQSKLLRVLEEREFYHVGGTKPISFKARLIVSTNRDLRHRVDVGKFREDLYYRIAVFEIKLPALRDRRSDIPLLAEHFVKHFNREMKQRCPGVDDEVVRMLMAYSWPGNVRELRNVIEHAMIVSRGDRIGVAHLPPDIGGDLALSEHGEDLRQAVRAYEREHIRRTLAACDGNKERAARRLGIDPSTLYRKTRELGLAGDGEIERSPE